MPSKSGPTGSLLIRGGVVVDGTCAPRYRADVRLTSGVIAEIGQQLRSNGEETLDADGAFVTPGFIESHSHFDPDCVEDWTCDAMPLQGVTTLIAGNCSGPVPATGGASIFDRVDAVINKPWVIPDDCLGGNDRYAISMESRHLAVNVVRLIDLDGLCLSATGEVARMSRTAETVRTRIPMWLDKALQLDAAGLAIRGLQLDRNGRVGSNELGGLDAHELDGLLSVLAKRSGHLEVALSLDPADLIIQIERWARLCSAGDVTMTLKGLSSIGIMTHQLVKRCSS